MENNFTDCSFKNSKKIKERFFEVTKKGSFDFGDEIDIIKFMIERHKPKSLSEYAKISGKTINGVKDKIKRGKLVSLKIIDKTFIFE